MKAYENLLKTLDNLADIYQYQPPYGNVEMIGIVRLFELCFEQAWKAMKELLEANGISEGKTGSPKMILKAAYQAGMIQDEDVWLDALTSRNNVAHSYNKEIALDIINNTKERYYEMFRQLDETMQREWL